jgi:two-component system sensor histidine kinase KdpD
MRQAVDLDQLDDEPVTGPATLESELLHASRAVHRLGREVEGLRQRLALAKDEREELLTVVSHELRTPLTVIVGYVRLLLAEEAGPINAEQRNFLTETQKGCEKLDDFVTRTLEAARTSGDVEVLEVSTRSLVSVVAEVGDLLRGPLADRGLCFENAVDPEDIARFDPAGIERVLLNLVGNAVRFARKTIRVSTRSFSVRGRPLVEVSVTDDGPGIPDDELERIFAPYVRREDASHPGVGLGLALCRRLVEAHGGEIRAESSGADGETSGARFRFTLPGREA